MAQSCDRRDLAEASACFTCFNPKEQAAVQTYLLAVMNGGSLDRDTLLDAAKCFTCLTQKQLLAIEIYLLCQLLNR